MTARCFKELGTGSFFGDYVYEQTVPGSHFLRQLDEVVELKRYPGSSRPRCRRRSGLSWRRS